MESGFLKMVRGKDTPAGSESRAPISIAFTVDALLLLFFKKYLAKDGWSIYKYARIHNNISSFIGAYN